MIKWLNNSKYRGVNTYEIPGPSSGVVLKTAAERYEYDGRSAPRADRWHDGCPKGLPRDLTHLLKRLIEDKTRIRELTIAVTRQPLELHSCAPDGSSGEPAIELAPSTGLPAALVVAKLSGFQVTVMIDEYERFGCAGVLSRRGEAELDVLDHLMGARLPLWAAR